MINKYLNFLPAIALLIYVQQACAIGITLTNDSSNIAVSTSVDALSFGVEDVQTISDLPYSVTTSAQQPGGITSSGAWSFTNSTNQAVLTGNVNLSNPVASPNSSATAFQHLSFSLSEQADYALTGNLLVTPNSVGAAAGLTGEIYLVDTNNDIYFGESIATSSGLIELPSVSFGTNTGSLAAGNYIVRLTSYLKNGDATGGFTLTLNTTPTTPPDNGGGGSSVPDTGSTVMLLGMALAGIGGIRHKLKI
jgi:hypothetical protein